MFYKGSLTSCLLASLLVLQLTGCSQGDDASNKESSPSTQQGQALAPSPKISVTTTKVIRGSLQEEIEVSGVLRSKQHAYVTSKRPGIVTAISTDRGDLVQQGEVLIWLESADVEAQVAQASAGLRATSSQLRQAQIQESLISKQTSIAVDQSKQALLQAQSQLKQVEIRFSDQNKDLLRQKELYDQGAISLRKLEQSQLAYEQSQQQLEASKAQVTQAKNQLALSRSNLQQGKLQQAQTRTAEAQIAQADANLRASQTERNYYQLTTPISGTIISRKVEIGQAVGPGSGPLLEVLDNDLLELEIQLPEKRINHLSLGTEIELSSPALKEGETVTATLSKILPTADPKSHSVTALFLLPYKTPGLYHGMFLSGELDVGEIKGWVIPSHSILKDNQSDFVYLDDKGTSKRVNVVTKLRGASQAVVSSKELSENSLVVTSGQSKLSTGERLDAQTATPSQPSQPQK